MELLTQNFIWMAAANFVSSFVNIALFIYVARTLMPEAFGYLSYVSTIVYFIANFIDLGLSTYGIREIAKDRSRASEYVREILSFRFIIATGLFIICVIWASLSPHTNLLKLLIVESALMLFVWGFAMEWAFQGIENMKMVFISFTITSILQASLVYIFVKKPSDLFKIPLFYFIAGLPVMVIFLRYFKFSFRLKREDFRRMVSYLSSSLIIWSIAIFAQIYNNLDIFILGLFRTIGEVGYFTIARRVTGGVALLLIFLANAVLPRLSFTSFSDPAQFNAAMRRFVKLAILITIWGFLPLIVFSKEIILLTVGPEYLPANIALKIMICGLIFVLFNLPYSTGLIACGFEKEVLKQAAASACLSIFSNFLLIPRYGMIGASISFVLAEILALVWILFIYNSKVRRGIHRVALSV